MTVTLPLSDGHFDLSLPECDVTVAEPPGGEPVDVGAAAERALADPRGRSLGTLTSPGDAVTIVVPDAMNTLLV